MFGATLTEEVNRVLPEILKNTRIKLGGTTRRLSWSDVAWHLLDDRIWGVILASDNAHREPYEGFRLYQAFHCQDCAPAALNHLRAPQRRALFRLPTGTGKLNPLEPKTEIEV